MKQPRDRLRRRTGDLQAVARELRREMTAAEALLWEALRNRRLAGLKFRRQHAVGISVLDFYCPIAKLVVEVDGSVHDSPEAVEHDTLRTEHIESFGYRVLRIRNEDVVNDLPAVLDRIHRAAT